VVQHGETGLVYPAGDRAALTGCLRRLIDEPALRQRLAVAGRARAMRSGPGDFAALAARAMLAAARRSGYVPAG
jgi:glycosyltransferase involved in cell wall biosynthesis